MIVGTHTSTTARDQINTILRAGQDLDLSIKVKDERQRARAYDNPLGCIEKIVFEVDKSFPEVNLRWLERHKMSRELYWPERCPMIARTKPEQDLIFTQPLRLPLPQIPDRRSRVENPYLVDQHGVSHLKNVNDLETPRMMDVPLERISSARSGRFLVFHPIAQISLLLIKGNAMHFGAFGDHRMPVSSLTGFDGRKMALLIDPYTGEAYFTGGRYQVHDPELKA